MSVKKGVLFMVACFVATISSAAIADGGVHTDYVAANQCRSQADDTTRLECYDDAVTPTRTKTVKKFESRDQCRDESGDGRRLACYDRFYSPTFAGAHVESDADDSGVNVGGWQTNIDTSPIDDSKNVVISVEGNDSFTTQFGQGSTPSLVISCRERKTELYIDWGAYLGLDETTMIHRIDKQKAVNRTWSISTDTNAVFYRGNVVSFIKNLSSGKTLFAEIIPYNANAVSTTFNLEGLSGALKPLQKSCGWR